MNASSMDGDSRGGSLSRQSSLSRIDELRGPHGNGNDGRRMTKRISLSPLRRNTSRSRVFKHDDISILSVETRGEGDGECCQKEKVTHIQIQKEKCRTDGPENHDSKTTDFDSSPSKGTKSDVKELMGVKSKKKSPLRRIELLSPKKKEAIRMKKFAKMGPLPDFQVRPLGPNDSAYKKMGIVPKISKEDLGKILKGVKTKQRKVVIAKSWSNESLKTVRNPTERSKKYLPPLLDQPVTNPSESLRGQVQTNTKRGPNRSIDAVLKKIQASKAVRGPGPLPLIIMVNEEDGRSQRIEPIPGSKLSFLPTFPAESGKENHHQSYNHSGCDLYDGIEDDNPSASFDITITAGEQFEWLTAEDEGGKFYENGVEDKIKSEKVEKNSKSAKTNSRQDNETDENYTFDDFELIEEESLPASICSTKATAYDTDGENDQDPILRIKLLEIEQMASTWGFDEDGHGWSGNEDVLSMPLSPRSRSIVLRSAGSRNNSGDVR